MYAGEEEIDILQLHPPDDDRFNNDDYVKKKKKKSKKHKDSSLVSCRDKHYLQGIHPFEFGRQLMLQQMFIRAGDQIPYWMILDPHQDGGFHFGVKRGWHGKYIGKPQDVDGHILVVGGPGSGKTREIVNPTLYSWGGHTVTFDIKTKGNLSELCKRASHRTGKHFMLFNPMREGGLGYDAG